MITFLWTKNNLPGSKLIQWGLDEPVSHFAILSDNVVLESRLETGYAMDSYEAFKKRNTLVYALKYNSSPGSAFQLELQKSIHEHCQGTSYDTNGVLWWAMAAIRRKIFGIKPPSYNQWQDKHRFYCVEILTGSEKIILDYLGVKVEPQVQTPYGLYLYLKRSKQLTKI